MAMRLADRLIAARRRRFVGRAFERNTFSSALTDPELPFNLLHIYGPGGIGKTSLLSEFIVECHKADIPALFLDAHHVDATPQGFLSALRQKALEGEASSAWANLQEEIGRHVLLVDSYDFAAPLDDWLRTALFPQMIDTLIVLASRDPLPPAWTTDLGWQGLIRSHRLPNLTPDESRNYLDERGVPQWDQDGVIDFTHGHPLALSLVADLFAQRPGISFKPETAPDVIKTLLEHLVQKVPGPAHRAALEACALARWTTEDLLAAMLANPDVHDLFEWLRGLSFISAGPFGLFPHDLARDALVTDLRWRNPEWFGELHERARRFYYARLLASSGAQRQRLVFDYIYLHRHSPFVRPYMEWQDNTGIFPDTLRELDVPHLVAMVARNEGDESARLAAHWMERQPEGVTVFRDSYDVPAGFVHKIALERTSPSDRELDPAVRAAHHFLHEQAPLRPGETATLFRFWMAHNSYQDVSAVQSLVFVNAVLHYLTVPGLAVTFFPVARPDFWAPVFTYASLARVASADFEVGGRSYGIYGNDWRVLPPLAWLDALARQGSSPESDAKPAPRTLDTVTVLSQEDFAAAVRAALRSYESPQALRASPLLHSRLVIERAGTRASVADKAAVLRQLLEQAIAVLAVSPRDRKLERAMAASFLHPSATQEQTAEELDLPFSTYRRHIQMGIERVTDWLWEREVGEQK